MLKLKRAMKRFFAACAVMAVAVASFQVAGVNAAAKNKALQISFSFDGKNDAKESEAEKAWFNNQYDVMPAITTKEAKIHGAKMSGQIYVPKTVLKKKNSRLNIGTGMGLFTKEGVYAGDVQSRYNFNIENVGGNNIEVHGWDNLKEKGAKAGSYATCKAGTGSYKSYYVITLKNVPVINKVYVWDQEKQELVPETLKTTAKYKFGAQYSICGLKTKTSGKVYFDNLEVTNGKNTISNVDFSKKSDRCTVNNKGKQVKSSKVKIVEF